MSEDEYNASDEEKVLDREHLRKNERDQDLEDVRFILSVASGVRFFRRLFTEGRILQTTFTGNSQGFFLEGQRNLALKFLADVCEAAPDRVAEVIIKKKESKS